MRRLRTVVVVFVLLGLLLAGLARAQPQSGIVRPTTEPTTPSVQLGEQLYAGNCASCHGVDGAGISSPRIGAGGIPGAGPSLKGVGAMAADFYLRTGYMPLGNFRSQPERDRVLLSDTEIRSLESYVATLGRGPGVPTPDPRAGTIGEGFQLFTEHCAGCHQAVAQGGFVTGARVPPLQSATPTEIAEAVRIGPYLMPKFSSRQISDAQLNSIVNYVLWTRRPENRGGWGIGNIGPVPEGVVTWFLAAAVLIAACVALGRRLRA